MVVATDSPHRLKHAGTTYLFCSAGCVETFRATPEAYLAPVPAPAAGHVDPVCGMSVAADSPHRLEHDGSTYRFCCAGCVEKFRADPARFLAGRAEQPRRDEEPPTAAAEYICPMHPEVRENGPGSCPKCGMALEPAMPPAARTQWTCPMHPEIVRDEPGDCPICGMALEPTTADASSGGEPGAARHDAALLGRRGPDAAAAGRRDGRDAAGSARSIGSFRRARLHWLELALATPVVLWGGWPFFARGWRVAA